MGLIAKLLQFSRATRTGAHVSDSLGDPGGGPNLTAQHFADPGDDSHPLPGDYYAAHGVKRSGSAAAVGYVDPKNAPKAGPGEKRTYARDANGAPVVETWLKSDGTAVTENANVTITAAPDGTVTTDNGAAVFTIGSDGHVTAENGGGYFTLGADGTVTINGVTIDPAGLVITPNQIVTPSAVVGGVEAAGHTHPQGADSSGDSQQDTGAMQ